MSSWSRLQALPTVGASWQRWSAATGDALRDRSLLGAPSLHLVVGLAFFSTLAAGSSEELETPLFAPEALWAGALGCGGVSVVTVAMWMARWRLHPTLVATVMLLGNVANELALLWLFDRAAGFASASLTLGFFVLLCAAVAIRFRASLRDPWMLAPMALALGVMAASGERGALVYVACGLFLTPSCIFLGATSGRLDEAVRTTVQLREEHTALLLELRDRENAELSDFLGRLAGHAHDLSSPALALEASIEALAAHHEELSPQARQLIGRAQADTTALVAMIREAKMELRHGAVPELRPVTLAPIARAVVARAQSRFVAVTIGSTGEESLQAEVRGGAPAVGRVLDNLVSNACAVARQVEVHIEAAGDVVTLRVHDDGPGFEQGYEPVPMRGLASVRRIAETSGGTLVLTRSTRLGGAAATVTLPRAR